MTTSGSAIELGPVGIDEPFLRRLGLIRILVASYATVWTAVRAPHLFDMVAFADRRFDPVGILAPLNGPPGRAVVVTVVVATCVCGVAAAAGWRYRVTAPALAVLFLVTTTYRHSWGQIFHTENLTAIHLAILALAPADRYWALHLGPDAATGSMANDTAGTTDDGGWAVRALAVATVAGYVVAGVAKLRNGGWAWIDGEVLVHQVAFDNARKEVLGDVMSPVAGFFIEHRGLARPAVLASMAVELGAPLALLGRRAGMTWSLAAWGFHMAILALMAIVFPYHLLGLAMIPLLPLEEWTARKHVIAL